MTQRILITSALPYINGVKHLGTLVGSMLPADVFARFARARGRETLFICATDEHGTPAELAALEEGLPIEEYCAKWAAIQKELGERFGLSWDHWGRSSSSQNRELTQYFAKTLWEQGFLDIRSTRQVYSHTDKRFLPDRYVIGTCPHCGYERARGDQCENCTRVLDPADLIKPQSALSGTSDIEIRDSKHVFLKQSLFADELRKWLATRTDFSPLVTSIALKWLDEGLQDRGITRDLKWGVPVNAQEWGPNPAGEKPDVEGLKDKVFYVWFDAPIEYIGATREWSEAIGKPMEWERWWRGSAVTQVRYFEFMGKDNVPFHTVGFPVTLLGANKREPEQGQWKLVDVIKGSNWLNYYGGKFSTTDKRGVFMDTALEILPPDNWRWYLIANSPENSDTSFTFKHFSETVNKDLADVLGNFANRTLKFAATRFDGAVPSGGTDGPTETKLIEDLERRFGLYTAHLEEIQFRKAAAELRAIWVLGNEYLAEGAPWTAIREDKARAALIIRTAVNMIRLFGILSAPIIPFTAEALLASVKQDPKAVTWPQARIGDELKVIQGGATIERQFAFTKILPEQVAAWEQRFGGAAS
jgi:methionyl-tRNA synthetase